MELSNIFLAELSMTIGEIRTRKAIIAPRETSIYEAAKLMREHHTGDVVGTDEFEGRKIPAGIVTDRDMVLEILAENLDPALLSVGEIMTDNPPARGRTMASSK